MAAPDTASPDDPAPSFDLEAYRAPADLERRAGWYARLLDRQIPRDCTLADLGCGTGQFSCFMARHGRRVTGVDYSPGNLARAERLRDKIGVDGVEFRRGDILELDLPDDSFDYVVSHGVLQNLPEPRRGFRQMARIARPGGYVVLGVYNRFGRLPMRAWRWILKRARLDTEDRRRRIVVRAFGLEGHAEESIRAYVEDQFDEPREKSFSFGEVLGWFAESALRWVGSYPPVGRAGRRLELFGDRAGVPPPAPGRLRRFLAQARWTLDFKDLGGLFIMVGRKHGTPHA